MAAYPAVLWLLTTRAAAAALLPAPLPARAHAAALAVVVGTGAVMSLRGTYGGESADQMLELVFCALLLAALRPTPAAPRLVLWFLALNACLAYATSGIYKVTSGAWRDGTNLTGVLSTRCHGDRRVAAWLTAHPVGAKWLSRGVARGRPSSPWCWWRPRSGCRCS
ncbi:hypothetical protein BLA24_01795 [Streptomyces cinnamoneus]|uniref:Uncharacterized protein n=1 Tax=Streptomyces cinnamoneus TaxID=53446 RepID=A0A2G1XQ46_STRCJ|nr:hypothetical protein [Streptomyces cinnamoneus]PHQ53356.1 hypothetical protein BLA24_01795 [Streptomyces cinnamoneus]